MQLKKTSTLRILKCTTVNFIVLSSTKSDLAAEILCQPNFMIFVVILFFICCIVPSRPFENNYHTS